MRRYPVGNSHIRILQLFHCRTGNLHYPIGCIRPVLYFADHQFLQSAGNHFLFADRRIGIDQLQRALQYDSAYRYAWRLYTGYKHVFRYRADHFPVSAVERNADRQQQLRRKHHDSFAVDQPDHIHFTQPSGEWCSLQPYSRFFGRCHLYADTALYRACILRHLYGDRRQQLACMRRICIKLNRYYRCGRNRLLLVGAERVYLLRSESFYRIHNGRGCRNIYGNCYNRLSNMHINGNGHHQPETGDHRSCKRFRLCGRYCGSTNLYQYAGRRNHCLDKLQYGYRPGGKRGYIGAFIYSNQCDFQPDHFDDHGYTDFIRVYRNSRNIHYYSEPAADIHLYAVGQPMLLRQLL